MQNYHAAFQTNEYVYLQSESILKELQRKFTGRPDQLGLHNIIPENMAAHAGKRAKITRVSHYHFGWSLYDLEGLPNTWPEEAIIDQDFVINDDHPGRQPAHLTYQAVVSDEKEMIEIRDRSGRIYCKLRKYEPEKAVADINRVAQQRSAGSFSDRYGFDGAETDEDWEEIKLQMERIRNEEE